jgi:NAD(P)H dehydrogenase (quinone)
MRAFVLYAHPVETSFQAALHRTTVSALIEAGHEVDDCDLYAENFDPVLSRTERINYHDVDICRKPVEEYVDRLLAADVLVLNFPVWNYGYPAILKGFFDRVFLPGVCFDLTDGNMRPTLHNIRRLVAVVTYGGSRWRTMLIGDPPRRVVKRAVRALAHPRASTKYLALYDLNNAGDKLRAGFIDRVKREMGTL